MIPNTLIGFLRNNLLKETKGRTIRYIGDCVVKKYIDESEARYEYAILDEITRASPQRFVVPKPVDLISGNNSTMLVMENIQGERLDSVILRYIIFRDSGALRILALCGRALRELHKIDLHRLKSYSMPLCYSKISDAIENSIRRPNIIEVHNTGLTHMIDWNSLDDRELMENVNLHGENYFTHITMSRGKPVFFDFHEACRGPAFYDLANFDISLYTSLLFRASSLPKLRELASAYWQGYLGRTPSRESMIAAEAYVTLREIEKMITKRNSIQIRIVNSIKAKRLLDLLYRTVSKTMIQNE